MDYTFFLLAVLIIIFFVSFCGLLQKIRESYNRERLIAERQLQQTNPAFMSESSRYPPPYTIYYTDPPPRYDDIIKDIHENLNEPRRSSAETPSVHQTGNQN